jgi:heme/copper-type cytochrome/quinol oxidase subunit 2
MNVVDLLVTIVVVTILVTIVLAVVTYVAYKLRLSRQPREESDDDGELRFFVRHEPAVAGAEMESNASQA